jgi:hypothetical protein
MAYDVGDRNAPAWLVTAGWLEVFRHDRLSGETHITDHPSPAPSFKRRRRSGLIPTASSTDPRLTS